MKPTIIEEFINKEQEAGLINLMPKSERLNTNDRNAFVRWGNPRAYSSNVVSQDIPDPIKDINFPYKYDSVSMNEYYEGQILQYHFDSPSSGNKIYIVSLLNDGELFFKRKENEFKIILKPRSLCVLEDELRWVWKHAMKANGNRYSLVFRNSSDKVLWHSICQRCDSFHYLGHCND